MSSGFSAPSKGSQVPPSPAADPRSPKFGFGARQAQAPPSPAADHRSPKFRFGVRHNLPDCHPNPPKPPQNRLFRNFFEKISAKPFAVSKPRRTFALAKRDKAFSRPARRRSLRDLHNRNCREVQEDRAVLLHRKECSGIQPLVNSTIDQDRISWAQKQRNKDSYITMKSLILAQDER